MCAVVQRSWLAALSVAVCVGCGSGGGGSGGVPSGSSAPATTTTNTSANPPPGISPTSSTAPSLLAARTVAEGRFVTSSACAECHSNSPQATAMRNANGEGIAPLDLWQATMMANAVRDPLFRAQVSVEIATTPSRAAEINQKCLTCHAPMATYNAASVGASLTLAGLQQDTERTQLALDGVSCTLCHSLQPDPAQIPSTFSGQFTLGTPGLLFGPHASPFVTPMVNRSGYTPAASNHMTQSSLCASCHTLYTSAYDASGTLTGGRLPEQTPYLEWQNSIYNDERARPAPEAASCQSCHTPTRDAGGQTIRTGIARAPNGGDFRPVGPRDPFGQHVFVGGNTLVPEILKRERADLKPPASDAAFDAVIDRARTQLQQKTASLVFGAATRSGDLLTLPVTVRNQAGHKFPTGHPVRRAWLRLVVTDASGAVVFASGQHDAEGRIVDDSGAVLSTERAGGALQSHHTEIARDDQVQIYQSLMADAAGTPTWLLLRGERYWKDNRLLPRGWSASSPGASETQPQGIGADPDFVAGADTVRYSVRAPLAGGPYRVEATLLYQPLSARYAVELFQHQTPEVQAFQAYYQRATRTPETVAQAVIQRP